MQQPGIPTFAINLKKRTDRKAHIIKEFAGRNEFSLHIVEAFEHPNGTEGLWNTLQHILSHLVREEDDFIIICEDDHQFTSSYSGARLLHAIKEAGEKNADILLGGVSWFSGIVPVSPQLFWTDNFSGLQFTVIFKKFIPKITGAILETHQVADHKIAALSCNKLFIYPFISIQCDFGYSDVTSKNNEEGRLAELFSGTVNRIRMLEKINTFYNSRKLTQSFPSYQTDHNMTIPTYVIHYAENGAPDNYIKETFSGRPEFDIVHILSSNKSNAGSWLPIRKIIELAIKNEDDVIIICTSNHQFTAQYSAEYLIKNIIEAHQQGANYLSGGALYTDLALPVAENRFWINSCFPSEFTVLFKKFFPLILEEPFDNNTLADVLYTTITSAKMILYPFISTQKERNHENAATIYRKETGIKWQTKSIDKLDHMQQAYRNQTLAI